MNDNKTAAQPLDLDKLAAIASRVEARGLFNAACDIRDWIQEVHSAQARAARLDTTASATCAACEGKPAAQNNPCAVCGRAAQPVQTGVAVDEPTIRTIVTKAREFYLGYLSRHIPGDDIDAVRADITTDTATRAIAFDLRATQQEGGNE